MRRITGLLLVLFSFALLPIASFAYSSNICTAGATCETKEVGPFMQGITKDCGNSGNCTLDDILLVFANTGNFVLGLVGGMVLLMYVIGGFYMLTAAGDSGRVTTGKKYLTISTTGLVIVMVAYLAINTLIDTLVVPGGTEGDKVAACQKGKDGGLCGDHMVCQDGLCVEQCFAALKGGICLNPEDPSNEEALSDVNCLPGLCAEVEEGILGVCCPAGL